MMRRITNAQAHHGRRAPLPLGLLAAAAALIAVAAAPAGGPPPSPSLAETIRARVEGSGPAPPLRAGETRHPSPWLGCFYERRGFEPAWVGEEGPLPQAAELAAAVAAAGGDGLRPADYHLAEIEERMAEAATEPPAPEPIAELDLLLSDAFLSYASHLRAGRADPAALYRDCRSHPEQEDLAAVLETALAAGMVRDALALLAPPHAGYARLRAALPALWEAAAAEGAGGAAERRLRQVEINLERWRWLPRDLGRRHVVVDVAAFTVRAVEEGRTELATRAIVGRSYTKTPSFSSAVDRVVLNPSWHVPAGIAANEVLPRAHREPGYLRREGFRVLPGGAVVQDPGPRNALGRIKFVFPNPFTVYLHDTPARSLFERDTRTFSHGCIRIADPLELAVWALRGDPRWSRAAIEAAIAAGREREVRLAAPIPIHLVYWTAWVDEQGTLELRDDVYGRDEPLLRLFAGE
ncbi:MAG TPA: L,D-transpeptidase family protein [Thermoanaerobaculia bacterium]